MYKGYSKDTVWKQIQEYLPEENRLNDSNLPNEEIIEFGSNTIHVDHYLCSNEKGVIIIYHGVGGNGRLLSFIAVPLRKAGYEVVCPDLPLYGHTICNGKVAYSIGLSVG